MVRVRRFGVIRTANLAAVVYFILVAIFVIPFALLVLASGTQFTVTTPEGGVQTGTVDSGGVIVFLLLAPLLYAAFGWIFTAISCLIYNLAARITGGIEVEVERREPPAPIAAVGNWGVPR